LIWSINVVNFVWAALAEFWSSSSAFWAACGEPLRSVFSAFSVSAAIDRIWSTSCAWRSATSAGGSIASNLSAASLKIAAIFPA
jgi:hypothetical protein